MALIRHVSSVMEGQEDRLRAQDEQVGEHDLPCVSAMREFTLLDPVLSPFHEPLWLV